MALKIFIINVNFYQLKSQFGLLQGNSSFTDTIYTLYLMEIGCISLFQFPNKASYCHSSQSLRALAARKLCSCSNCGSSINYKQGAKEPKCCRIFSSQRGILSWGNVNYVCPYSSDKNTTKDQPAIHMCTTDNLLWENCYFSSQKKEKLICMANLINLY